MMAYTFRYTIFFPTKWILLFCLHCTGCYRSVWDRPARGRRERRRVCVARWPSPRCSEGWTLDRPRWGRDVSSLFAFFTLHFSSPFTLSCLSLLSPQLNLASQSVLEGLNACFDHRAEIYIPELGMRFHVQQEKTKIFGCQNPFTQGGGRKGLPKSFLNRFTQVTSVPKTTNTAMNLIYIKYINLYIVWH